MTKTATFPTHHPIHAIKKIINAEDIQIGVVRQEENEDPSRFGTVSFFDDAKGFGFINDRQTQERIFVHINSLSEPIQASDKVTYEVESGPRGPVAVNVKKNCLKHQRLASSETYATD